MNKYLLFCVFCLCSVILSKAQTSVVKGIIKDEFNNPVVGADVIINERIIPSGENGAFEIPDIPYGNYPLVIKLDGFADFTQQVEVNKPITDLLSISMHHNDQPKSDVENIPTVTLSDDEVDASNSESASSVLNASRDAFQQAAIYKFSAARFRIRGYEDENFTTLINGIPTTDLTNGRTMYQGWSGLNDVLRSRESLIGLGATDYTFGGIGANYSIDTKASTQRQQLQVSYALSNRTYDNRLVGTYGSGVLEGGWSFSISASRRWADEGYVPGTFTDDFSYYASLEKIMGKHSLSLTRLASENITGRAAPSVQEAYDLAGTHYYNPNWGYQDGKKRNAAVGRNSQPITILTDEWNVSKKTFLQTSLSYQYGINSVTALDWYNAPDPRPTYYRKLPDYVLNDLNDTAGAALLTQTLTNNPDLLQIQWDELYATNARSLDTILNANGLTGDTVIGKFAAYIVEKRVTENKRFNFSTTLNTSISEHFSIDGGINFQHQQSDYYKTVDDLLGADFYVDYDKFADITMTGDSSLLQNDLNRPNRILHVGDRFGYDYTADIKEYGGWLQGNFKFKRVDFFAASNFSHIGFQRTGHTKDGVFPDDSYGKSKTTDFNNYGFKGGITGKLNGRNYLFANAAYLTRAPWFEDVFISPRTRNEVALNLDDQNVTSAEGGYLLRAPRMKARISFFYAQFNNDTRTLRFYNDDLHTFSNFTMTNIDKKHTGTEISFEATLGHGFSLNAAASIGRYLYTSRPIVYATEDNKDTVFTNDQIIYAKNYHVGGSPEDAYTIGVDYRAKRFWGFFINFNRFDKMYLEFNPVRRTLEAVSPLEESDPVRAQILEQKPFDSQFTIDVSFNKSWKMGNNFRLFKHNTFLVLNVGVDNITNNKNMIIGGGEQLRFDFSTKRVNKFAPKYIYGYGTSYFISLALRLN